MYVCTYTGSCQIAADGEGASHLLTCTVSGSRSEEAAERLAKAVVGSMLVKAAMFGADANWGRVLCAMGYSESPLPPRSGGRLLRLQRWQDSGVQGRRRRGV